MELMKLGYGIPAQKDKLENNNEPIAKLTKENKELKEQVLKVRETQTSIAEGMTLLIEMISSLNANFCALIEKAKEKQEDDEITIEETDSQDIIPVSFEATPVNAKRSILDKLKGKG